MNASFSMKTAKNLIPFCDTAEDKLTVLYNAILSDEWFSEIAVSLGESQKLGVVYFYLHFLKQFRAHQFHLNDTEMINSQDKASCLRLIKRIYNGEVNIQYLIHGSYHSRLSGSNQSPLWIKDIEMLSEWFRTTSFPEMKRLDALWAIHRLTELLLNAERSYQVKVPGLIIDAFKSWEP